MDIWWHSGADNYIFHDGTSDCDHHADLMHYRDTKLENVFAHCWDEIIENEVKFPATKLDDQDEKELHFDTPPHQPLSTPTRHPSLSFAPPDPLPSTPSAATRHPSTSLVPSNPPDPLPSTPSAATRHPSTFLTPSNPPDPLLLTIHGLPVLLSHHPILIFTILMQEHCSQILQFTTTVQQAKTYGTPNATKIRRGCNRNESRSKERNVIVETFTRTFSQLF